IDPRRSGEESLSRLERRHRPSRLPAARRRRSALLLLSARAPAAFGRRMSFADFTFCPRCRAQLVEAERGGRTRLVCTAEGCGFVHWNNPIPVVAAIVERDGRVILVRNHGRPVTWYVLVAG